MSGLEKCDTSPRGRPDLPRGIIDAGDSAQRIRTFFAEPPARLAPFIDRCWTIEWDLTERPPELQRVLPSPHAHFVITRGRTALFGVTRGVCSRQIEGAGRVLGLRFRAGGLRPFLSSPVAAITDRQIPAVVLTGLPERVVEERVLSTADRSAATSLMAAFIEARLPARDAAVDTLAAIIAAARRRDGPCRIEALADEAGLGVRSLQRLFHEYVGVSPKWVIRCYRLQEAAWQLARGANLQIAALAAELGYFDQAHLTRDFTRLFGCSPMNYRRRQRIIDRAAVAP